MQRDNNGNGMGFFFKIECPRTSSNLWARVEISICSLEIDASEAKMSLSLFAYLWTTIMHMCSVWLVLQANTILPQNLIFRHICFLPLSLISANHVDVQCSLVSAQKMLHLYPLIIPVSCPFARWYVNFWYFNFWKIFSNFAQKYFQVWIWMWTLLSRFYPPVATFWTPPPKRRRLWETVLWCWPVLLETVSNFYTAELPPKGFLEGYE